MRVLSKSSFFNVPSGSIQPATFCSASASDQNPAVSRRNSDKAEIEQQLSRAIEQAEALGAVPDSLPKVKELRAKLTDDAVDLNALTETRISALNDTALDKWLKKLEKPHEKADGDLADDSRLQAHLNRYVGRNTFDYFIHKDLWGFLRRELDFHVKNEVMHVDNIESEFVPRVEQYLSKTFRKSFGSGKSSS